MCLSTQDMGLMASSEEQVSMADVSSVTVPTVPVHQQIIPSLEKCALLGCYTASSSNFLPMFRDNLWVPYSGVKKDFWQTIGLILRGQVDPLTPDDGTGRLSRNIGKKLTLLAA
jgi:hypothetical protein